MPLKQIQNETPWYEKGLKFKCTQCGKCCTGEPGYVWLDQDDIERLCSHFGLERDVFLNRYAKKIGRRYSLLEDHNNYDCVLLKDNQCSAYNARPKQCKKFPWWESYITSQKAWDSAKEFCEGIDHPEGKHYTQEEIDELKEED
ncbi:MAG: YkgJ family cysteine cluster protein [Rhabdochlamydiaceae bacterium]|nr:YkgJ family cysteine cluster protein [Candidatus Amphrikana amoebophyrae]